MLAAHLVARIRIDIDLRTRIYAQELWRYLRRWFPFPIACIVMHDHLHLLLDIAEIQNPRHRLADMCGRVQRTCRLPPESWAPVPEPRIIANLSELRRQFRYVALNECRKGFSRDPLSAEWSTYREMFGAIADPWIDPAYVLRALRLPGSGSLDQLHAYVSGDPSCDVRGTPTPLVALPSAVPVHPLADIVHAAAAATRAPETAVQRRSPTRRAFVWLAHAQGWRDNRQLADLCHATPDAIRRIAARPQPATLQAGALCLGDPRLRLSRTRAPASRCPRP